MTKSLIITSISSWWLILKIAHFALVYAKNRAGHQGQLTHIIFLCGGIEHADLLPPNWTHLWVHNDKKTHCRIKIWEIQTRYLVRSLCFNCLVTAKTSSLHWVVQHFVLQNIIAYSKYLTSSIYIYTRWRVPLSLLKSRQLNIKMTGQWIMFLYVISHWDLQCVQLQNKVKCLVSVFW